MAGSRFGSNLTNTESETAEQIARMKADADESTRQSAKACFKMHNQGERRSHERAAEEYERQRQAEQKSRMSGLFDSLKNLKNGNPDERRPPTGSMADKLRDRFGSLGSSEPAASRFSDINTGSRANVRSRWEVPTARDSPPPQQQQQPRQPSTDSGSGGTSSGSSIADKLAGLRNRIGMIHVDWPAEAVRWSNFEDTAAKKPQLALADVPLPPAGWFKSGMDDKLYKQLCMRYHPDRFMQKFGKLFDSSETDSVMEAVVAVFQLLNDARNGV